jgi:predicted nuclease of predicted toxin-antitoxin system
MRFLIDECLSPHLVSVAHNRGFEAYHVAHRGWSTLLDPHILKHLLDEELILVTNNRDDFLRLIVGVELHPGLVIILENVRRQEQIRLFDAVLEAISGMKSLINKVIEIDAHGAINVFELPEVA